ncbi:hypothetical protein [Sporolactobacillus sp. KGMB 08714]|uniref:hypothetical protein n=1 Tax=Sporolactobacillus sp. KGMB 08714 TaxID=3064704 RepID=UPI002FBEC91E
MKIRVKFCGGCNPRYDRGEIVRQLRTDFPDIDVVFSGEAEADLVVVICGCEVACADHAALHGRLGKIILVRAEDYAGLRRLLISLKGV